jgi:hypothetical protein
MATSPLTRTGARPGRVPEIDDDRSRVIAAFGIGGSTMPGTSTHAPQTPTTLVWIDGDHAIVARWDGEATIRKIRAGIPPRHRSTGHVHRDPTVRHGGGGPVEDRLERARAERERAFLARVEQAIPGTDELLIVGPGVIHEHLAHRLREHDRQHRRTRDVRSERADHMTEHQIVARLRAEVGAEPKRGRRRLPSSQSYPSSPSSTTRIERRSRRVHAAALAPSAHDWDDG